MKCLIIAAGQGSRLRQRADSKPLLPIAGVPLIERVMHAARLGGAGSFHVVSGHQGARLRRHLDRVAARDGVTVRHVVNDRWREANGLSVLAARRYLDEPFLLLMADHLFDPSIVRTLLRRPPPPRGLVLAVDDRTDNPAVDLQDVTRLLHSGGRIRQIGKGIARYNAFDTGIFHCTPALFDAIALSIERDGAAGLSDGVRILAQRGMAQVHEIGGRFWLDVDDSRALVKAEVALIDEHAAVAARDRSRTACLA